jgi:hypothetical protein
MELARPRGKESRGRGHAMTAPLAASFGFLGVRAARPRRDENDSLEVEGQT